MKDDLEDLESLITRINGISKETLYKKDQQLQQIYLIRQHLMTVN